MSGTQTTSAVPAAGSAGRASSASPRKRRVRGTTGAFWLFVGPFLLGLAIFIYVPIVWSLVLSFFRAQNTVVPDVFVGVKNYVDMLTDSAFLGSLWTFTLFGIFIVPTTYVIALGLAVLINRARFARAFFRSAIFIPAACSYVVGALVWKLSIFNGVRFGLANTLLGMFGIDPVAWLSGTGDFPWYWPVVVTARLWLQVGFYMILLLAGLQQIPNNLYEAAYVDGAKPGWQTFIHVTLPGLRTTSVAVLILLLINAYQAFDEFYNLLGNVPYARPPLVYLYYTALGAAQDYGHGSAGALILSLIIAIVTIFQARVLGFGKAD
ncbi:carbohydrate ABC transporter permease [Fodinicola acaciae]|uniref:carbohydrate ABC transporter permease n=1 Tax=Fodinicola acaciae TaxID=2681555 RepID=UPI001FE2CB35|nr:sugar ABC transporter permease [Fodinicola acaciae]